MSALLGIGGGLVKVPVMHLAMGVPLRVATATSNLMIGITASASAIIYLLRGGIDPYVAGPDRGRRVRRALHRVADRAAGSTSGSCGCCSWPCSCITALQMAVRAIR